MPLCVRTSIVHNETLCVDARPYVTVTGTPGTGKSLLIYYFREWMGWMGGVYPVVAIAHVPIQFHTCNMQRAVVHVLA